jgi:hypothetical protein
MSDPELEAFKTGIDLRAYAATQGYQLDRRESWVGSAVMRHANDDKIIIKVDKDGHWVYFSVRDDRDNGTIIDFTKKRLGCSLGTVRKELRPFIGAAARTLEYYAPLPRVAKDRVRVERSYARMKTALSHPYLENERRIPREILESNRFAGRIRIDGHSNAVFPHFDRDGQVCGYEIRGSGYKGFATGGTKGLWLSHQESDDNRLVFTESAIDGLSYAVLFPDDRTRYGSIGGQVNPLQPELLRSATAAMPPDSTIVAAMDADAQGAKLADIVRHAVEFSGRDDLSFVIQEPPAGFKDFNDVLRGQPKPPLPYRAVEPSIG